MMRVVTCLATLHNLWLVAFAAAICVGGSWVAFGLFRRARQREGIQRAGWIVLAAIAAGASVWCTHFIAMLSYDVGAPVIYDPLLTMISLLVVIIGAMGALHLAVLPSRRATAAAGALLGASVAAMHYLGMWAYRVDGFVSWDAAYVAASVALAIAFSILSLGASRRERHVVSLLMFVAAVVTLHFTGMTALSVEPLVTRAVNPDAFVDTAMAVAVAGVVLIVIGTGVAAYLIDSDVREKNLDALRQLAVTDALTGLPNRAGFGARLAHELDVARASGRELAVIGIDLNKFKEINDLRGHEAGDAALRTISARLAAATGEGEYVARIGGDEFAALKRVESIEDLHRFIGRLEAELIRPMRIVDFDVAAGASIGVSLYPRDATTAERLVGNADLAMYRAKADMARTVCFYEPDMDEAARSRRDLSFDLRRAVGLGQFELHYQVQNDVASREVLGYEVLLRWKHPARGFVSPAEFIPLAEESGAIIEIGEWVLRQACREAAGWPGACKIAVNISAVQLMQPNLPQIVQAALVEGGLSPSRLELEITESSIIKDKIRSLHALRMIRSLGVTIAIDDFGTGYSSLDTLRTFPFDRIKLDRSFMQEVEDSAQARAIIRAVLALGKSLDIPVLAEGVETEQQLTLLRAEGCDEAQGFLLGRPAPAAHFHGSEGLLRVA